MNISYDYYRVFYYVAKYKSITAAAAALMNNQPNITRIIKKLEDGLGCTLFVRQRHGVVLTPAGEKLYAHIAVAFEHILCGEQEIAKEQSLQSGVVTVAASEIALHCVLLPALKIFRKEFPGIHIKILNYSTPQAIDGLKKGLADFAVVTEPFELPAEISSNVLRDVQEVPVCSNAFSLKAGAVLTKSDLMKYPLIGLSEKTSSFPFYTDFFHRMGLSFIPEVEAATADQILPMIKSDLGIGFVPVDFLENENMEMLKVLNIKPEVPTRSICLLKRKNISLSIAASELEDQIFKKFEK